MAAVLYTSATTGRPKGVMLTQSNVVSNTHATVHHLRMTAEDRGLCALPLFHCFGQNFIMNALVAAAGTLVLQERFVPAEFLAAVAAHRVTLLYAVPTMYIVLLAAGWRPHDLSSLSSPSRLRPCCPATSSSAGRRRTGRPISQGYGLTESSPFATYNHEHAHRPGSVGDADRERGGAGGRRARTGRCRTAALGEIVIRGPNVMRGTSGSPRRRPRRSAEAGSTRATSATGTPTGTSTSWTA